MIEPVKLADFFTVFFSAASVILFGASYALLFAWSRVRNKPRLMPLAYAAYGGLVVSVSFWTFIVLLMLVGYLVAPQAIWHLCVGTHAAEHEEDGDPIKVYQQR